MRSVIYNWFFIFLSFFLLVKSMPASPSDEIAKKRVKLKILDSKMTVAGTMRLALQIENKSDRKIGFWHPSSPLGGGSISFICEDAHGEKCTFYTPFNEWLDGGKSLDLWIDKNEKKVIGIDLENWRRSNDKISLRGKNKIIIVGELFQIK